VTITFCREVVQLFSDEEISAHRRSFGTKVADPSWPLEDTDFKSRKKVNRSGEQAHFRLFLEKNLQLKIPV
jgi:hypothetical protein